MPRRSALFLACLVLFACTSVPNASREVAFPPQDQSEVKEEKRRSVLIDLLLYVPNRVLDVFDIARAGASVGPGLGVDLTATDALNASLMSKASVGLGFQTLRRLPVEAASYSSVGLGPLKAAADPGLAWYRSPGDIRVGLHALLAGGHVAVEPLEMLDLVLGFVFIDFKKDDL